MINKATYKTMIKEILFYFECIKNSDCGTCKEHLKILKEYETANGLNKTSEYWSLIEDVNQAVKINIK